MKICTFFTFKKNSFCGNYSRKYIMYFGNVDKLKLTLTIGKPKVSFSTLHTFFAREAWLADALSIPIATSNTVMGGWQQAGNILRLEGEGPWMCEVRDMWEGTLPEKLVRKDLTQANGKEYPYGDRRQELVFIGIKLKMGGNQKCCILLNLQVEVFCRLRIY